MEKIEEIYRNVKNFENLLETNLMFFRKQITNLVLIIIQQVGEIEKIKIIMQLYQLKILFYLQKNIVFLV